jgi:putative transposase
VILRRTSHSLPEENHAITSVNLIDPESFVADQLAAASPDLLRSLLSTFIQALMGAEADAICGAGYAQRSVRTG